MTNIQAFCRSGLGYSKSGYFYPVDKSLSSG